MFACVAILLGPLRLGLKGRLRVRANPRRKAMRKRRLHGGVRSGCRMPDVGRGRIAGLADLRKNGCDRVSRHGDYLSLTPFMRPVLASCKEIAQTRMSGLALRASISAHNSACCERGSHTLNCPTSSAARRSRYFLDRSVFVMMTPLVFVPKGVSSDGTAICQLPHEGA